MLYFVFMMDLESPLADANPNREEEGREEWDRAERDRAKWDRSGTGRGRTERSGTGRSENERTGSGRTRSASKPPFPQPFR